MTPYILRANYLTFVGATLTIDWFVREELAQISQPLDQIHLIIPLSLEADINFIRMVFLELEKHKFYKITFLADIGNKNILSNFKLKNNQFDIVYVHFWAILTSYHTKNPSTHVDLTNPVGLFITGRLARPSRIGLLLQLYRKGLLPDLIKWSFPLTVNDLDELDQYLNISDSKEFLKLCVDHAEEINDFDFVATPDSRSHFCFEEVYTTTSYSIVSETYTPYQTTVRITEKPFRAIINKHPFITVGFVGTNRLLQEYGFKTYDEYLPYQYDDIQDQALRFTTIVDNIEAFPSCLLAHKTAILADIEHNFNHMQSIVSNTQKQINDLFDREVNIPLEFGLDPGYLFGTQQYHDVMIARTNKLIAENQIEYDQRILAAKQYEWIRHYRSVAGPTWPNINSDDEWHLIPQDIQEECINTFNIVPKQYNNLNVYYLVEESND